MAKIAYITEIIIISPFNSCLEWLHDEFTHIYNWSHSKVKQFEIHQVSSNSFFALAVLFKSSNKLSLISLKEEVLIIVLFRINHFNKIQFFVLVCKRTSAKNSLFSWPVLSCVLNSAVIKWYFYSLVPCGGHALKNRRHFEMTSEEGA